MIGVALLWPNFSDCRLLAAELLAKTVGTDKGEYVAGESVTASDERFSSGGREIAFIDSSVSGYQQLAAAVAGAEVRILDATRDGVQQISEVLAQRKGIEAVHIVSHGAAGKLLLGSAGLDAESVAGYSQQLAGWGDSLAEDADILIYGCNVAAGPAGTALVDRLAHLTGADVAASTNATGAAALCGDWNLEYAAGAIDTPIVFAQEVHDAYGGLLISQFRCKAPGGGLWHWTGVWEVHYDSDPDGIPDGNDEVHIGVRYHDPNTLDHVWITDGSSFPRQAYSLYIASNNIPNHSEGKLTIQPGNMLIVNHGTHVGETNQGRINVRGSFETESLSVGWAGVVDLTGGTLKTKTISGYSGASFNFWSGTIASSSVQNTTINKSVGNIHILQEPDHEFYAYSGRSINLYANLDGSGPVRKTGPGILNVYSSGNNGFTGSTTISQGTVRLQGSGSLSNKTDVIVNGGTFDIRTYSDTVDAVQLLNGTIAGSGTLTGSSYDVRKGTISAKLGGSGKNLTKSTSSTVTLSGANTYTGTTTVNAGSLRLGAHNVLHNSSDVTVNGGTFDIRTYSDTVDVVKLYNGTIAGSGTLTANSFEARKGTINIALAGSASLTKTTNNLVTLTGNNDYTGGTTVSEGTLKGNTTSLQGNIDNNATLIFDQSGSGTYSGNITGVGNLFKQASGTLTFSGSNPYTGATNVNAGTLTLDGSIGTDDVPSGLLTVAAATTFDGSGTIDATGVTNNGTIEGGLTLRHASPLTNSNVLQATGGQTLTIDNCDIVNSGILRATGGGTLKVTGRPSAGSTVDLAGTGLLSDVGSFVEYGFTTVSNGFLSSIGGGTHRVTDESKFENVTIDGSVQLAADAQTTLQNVTNRGTIVNRDLPGEARFMDIIGGSNSGTLEIHGTATVYPDSGGLPWTSTGEIHVSDPNAALVIKQDFVVDQGARVTVTGPTATWLNNLRADDTLASVYVGGDASQAGGAGEIVLDTGVQMAVGERLKIWKASAAAKGRVTLSNMSQLVAPLTEVSGVLELDSSFVLGNVDIQGGNVFLSNGGNIFGATTGGAAIVLPAPGKSKNPLDSSLSLAKGELGTITVSGGTSTVGDEESLDGFDFQGNLVIEDGAVLEVLDLDTAFFGASTTMTNGVIVAHNGLSIDQSDTISGYGVIVGEIAGDNLINGLEIVSAPTGTVSITEPLELGDDTAIVCSLDMATLGPSTTIDGGTIIAASGLKIGQWGSLLGSGEIKTPTLINEGSLTVKDLVIVGDYKQGDTASLIFEIGDAQGVGDQAVLQISGDADFSGEVVFKFVDGYSPSEGEEFNISIDVLGETMAETIQFETANLATGFDFNASFDSDGGMFTMTASNDAVFVPEPSSLVLAAIGAIGLLVYFGRRRTQADHYRAHSKVPTMVTTNAK